MLPSQKKKLRAEQAERAAMQPQYDPNDPDAIVPVEEDMIQAAPGQQLVTTHFAQGSTNAICSCSVDLIETHAVDRIRLERDKFSRSQL